MRRAWGRFDRTRRIGPGELRRGVLALIAEEPRRNYRFMSRLDDRIDLSHSTGA
ncbi:hypothetical protein [Nonomuraea phyllanthi]|uniref:hypothetical protein n=1 Tax=Nonomuraea phyllanthi TaxID=2219224 RepID=UPI001294140C|nr:hypothetical protein [Nonomuraea phyllanthi]